MQRTPTTVNLASANTSTLAEPVIFNITLTAAILSGQPSGRRLLQNSTPLGGQNVSITFGDGSTIATLTTASDGTASTSHTYAALGTYNASATFAGRMSLYIHKLQSLWLPMKGVHDIIWRRVIPTWRPSALHGRRPFKTYVSMRWAHSLVIGVDNTHNKARV